MIAPQSFPASWLWGARVLCVLLALLFLVTSLPCVLPMDSALGIRLQQHAVFRAVGLQAGLLQQLTSMAQILAYASAAVLLVRFRRRVRARNPFPRISAAITALLALEALASLAAAFAPWRLAGWLELEIGLSAALLALCVAAALPHVLRQAARFLEETAAAQQYSLRFQAAAEKRLDAFMILELVPPSRASAFYGQPAEVPDFLCCYANPGCQTLLGLEAGVIGQRMNSQSPALMAGPLGQALNRAQEQRLTIGGELPGPPDTLGFRSLIFEVIPLEGCLAVTVRDVSPIRRGFAALEQSQQELQATFDVLGEGIAVINRDGTLRRANGRAGEMIAALAPQNIGARPELPLATRRNGGPLPNGEWPFHITRANGVPQQDVVLGLPQEPGQEEPRWISMNVRRLSEDEMAPPYAVVVSFGDVSERILSEVVLHSMNQELERRVRQRTHALAEANRELEDFTSLVSHDLRAPLRAVSGYAQILREDYGDRLDEEGQRVLQVVKDESIRMGRLIDDLLQFARVGRADLHREAVDMRALAQQCLREIGADPAHVEIDDLPPAAGDPILLRQVWINLLDNAVKYSRSRPSPSIKVSGISDGHSVTYAVADNGVGFDSRYQDKLFEMFQRLHAEADFEGTGVGLAIVQRVVHRHGGQVAARSILGQGATFRFTLPAATIAVPADELPVV